MKPGFLFGAAGGALEIRAGANGGARIAGRFPYGARAVLGDIAGRGRRREERFAPRAFEQRIIDPQADIYLLAGHAFDRPLASRAAGSLAVAESDDVVTFEAALAPEIVETTHGRDALALLRAGLATGLSPGFIVAPDGERVTQEGEAILRTITRAELFEISIVTVPAYPTAQAEARNWTPDPPSARRHPFNRWRR
jgi:hypothetical protein